MAAALVEPAAQGCVCEVDAESMTEAVGVDDRARRTVDGNGDRAGEAKIVASDAEGVAAELLPDRALRVASGRVCAVRR